MDERYQSTDSRAQYIPTRIIARMPHLGHCGKLLKFRDKVSMLKIRPEGSEELVSYLNAHHTKMKTWVSNPHTLSNSCVWQSFGNSSARQVETGDALGLGLLASQCRQIIRLQVWQETLSQNLRRHVTEKGT